uniref:GT4 n=1 Tax=Magnetococcus massalia (strain MO-1) TaxID=451514 RepID=A0A1S7LIL4_MAGMO|nr:protein of unknown function [Candidatus Magnetococcus massalia]
MRPAALLSESARKAYIKHHQRSLNLEFIRSSPPLFFYLPGRLHMRIIIIDHALTKKLGHFYGMHKGLRQLFSHMGIPTLSLINLKATPDIVEEFGAIPAFKLRPFFGVGKEVSHTYYMKELVAYAEEFAYSLHQYLSPLVQPGDLFLFPYCHPHELLAVSLWQKKLPAIKQHRFIFNMMQIRYLFTSEKKLWQEMKSTYQVASRELSNAVKTGNAHVLIHHEEELLRLQQEMEIPVHFVPLPMNLLPLINTEHSRNPEYDFGFFGLALERKGFHFLNHIIKNSCLLNDPPSFFIQNTTKQSIFTKGEQSEIIKRTKIHEFFGNMEEEEYVSFFQKCRFILIPYNQSLYEFKSSGVFIESLACGKPMLVTGKTWMSQMLNVHKGSGIIIKDWTPSAYVQGVALAMKYQEKLIKHAQSQKDFWLNQHGLSTYVQTIIKLFTQ